MRQIDEVLQDLRLAIGGLQRLMQWQRPIKPGSHAMTAHSLHKRLGGQMSP